MCDVKGEEVRTERGADVQAVPGLGGYPVLVEPDEVLDELEERLAVECLRGVVREGGRRQGTWRTGRAMRLALVFMRFMFMSGLNIRMAPVGSLYAFMPSKIVCA